MQRSEHQVAGLGRFQGRGKGFLIPDFADQNHIGVFPQGRPQGVVESEGVQPHFPVPDEGLAALVHELDGILDREDVACLVAVDPIDHGRQGCAFAGPCRSGHQDQSLRTGREALQHAGEIQLLHGEDRLRNQAQHHRRAPQ